MSDDDLRRLLDLEAIKQLKARYCRLVDTKQWERLATLFTPDTRFEGFGSAPTGSDPTAFIDGISSRLRDAVSIHHCHTPEIVFTGPDSARGIWAMMDLLQFSRRGRARAKRPAGAAFAPTATIRRRTGGTAGSGGSASSA